MCNCKWTEIVLAVLILIFAIWPATVSWSNWIVIIAAAILLIHALMCKDCGKCAPTTKVPVKKKKK